MTEVSNTVYKRAPIRYAEDIPVFSEIGDYSSNYATIARDHLEKIGSDSDSNPWIDEWDWQTMEESTERLLTKYVPAGSSVLDVGVGLGRLLSRYPQYDRYGVDISFDYLARARKAGINVCYCGVESLPYHDHFFDAVICTDVLEHVLDVNAALDPIWRVLKPGGILITRVPYAEDLSSYLEDDYPYRFAHLRNFDDSSLRLLLCRIFPFEWCEVSYAHLLSSAKFRIPIRFLGAVMVRVFLLLSAKSPAFRRKLARIFFTPFEISVVVAKPDVLADARD